jgi:hypothetical protein
LVHEYIAIVPVVVAAAIVMWFDREYLRHD